MSQRIVEYLRRRKAPVSAVELAEEVLKMRPVHKEAAEKLIASIAKDYPGIVRTTDGFWQVQAELLAEATLAKTEFVLCRIQPTMAQSWLHWKSIGISTVVDGSETKRTIVFPGSKIKSSSGSLIRGIETAIRLAGDRPMIFDGFGNQISLYRQAVRNIAGLWLENQIFSLRRLTQRLFPEATLQEPGDLSSLFNLQIIEDVSGAIHWETLYQPFSEIIRILQQRGIVTLEQLVEFYEGEKLSADFSKFAFESSFLESLPDSPGVYIMHDRSRQIIYVGKAKKLNRRLRSYFSATEMLDDKLRKIRDELYEIRIQQTGSELEALLLEQELIAKHDPPINRQLQVKMRRHRQKSRYSRILLLPSAEEDKIRLYLFEPALGLQIIDLMKDFSNIEEAQKAVKKSYFTRQSEIEQTPDERLEIAATWLSLHDEEVNSIDMRRVASVAEALRLIMEHAKSLLQGEEPAIYY
jgi:hypothetical protein